MLPFFIGLGLIYVISLRFESGTPILEICRKPQKVNFCQFCF